MKRSIAGVSVCAKTEKQPKKKRKPPNNRLRVVKGGKH
jgi:hypothetical protein